MKTFLCLLSLALVASAAAAENRARANGLQPIRIGQPISPVFPAALAQMYPNGGHARILVTVRADGEVAEWLVTAYSAVPFKHQAEATLKELTFAAARLDGEPIAANTEIMIRFETQGVMVSMTPAETINAMTQSTLDSNEAYRAYPIGALDRVPAALQTEAPSYPKEVATQGIAGNVTVNFYIDEKGDVRMPSVVQYDPLPLTVAAVRAIRRWKFEPPLRHGKPVLVKAQQVFNFSDDPPAKR